MKYFMILRTLTTRIFIIYVIYMQEKDLTYVRITQVCIFDEFSFSTKGLIYPISVGIEWLNGIPMEIFRLCRSVVSE